MTTTERPERSVPKPVFTDAEAGAQTFPDSGASARRYNYFKPAKRKQTHYERKSKGRYFSCNRHISSPYWKPPPSAKIPIKNGWSHHPRRQDPVLLRGQLVAPRRIR
jgi:hypothetical protein